MAAPAAPSEGSQLILPAGGACQAANNDDEFAWELFKENVQPIKRGRLLQMGLGCHGRLSITGGSAKPTAISVRIAQRCAHSQ